MGLSHYCCQFFQRKDMYDNIDDLPTKLKIVFLGNSNVGKTSLIESFIKNKFRDYYEPTVSIDFFTRTFTYQDKLYKLQLWDSAGQERFTSLATNYIKNADCAIIVIDVSVTLLGSDPEKEAQNYVLSQISKWTDLFNMSTQVKSFAFVVGNKIDKQQRTIPSKLVEEKANEQNLKYYEVSAKTGQNVEALFNCIIDHFQQVSSLSQIKAHSARPKLLSAKDMPLSQQHARFNSLNVFSPTTIPGGKSSDSSKRALSRISNSELSSKENRKCNC